MATFIPYLSFDGTCADAFTFYKAVFGGDFATFSRIKDMPGSEHMPPGDQQKIMHVLLITAKGTTLMGSDSFAAMGHTFVKGTNVQISIQAESKEEASDLYNKLAAGGKVEIEIQDAPWGAYFGKVEDKFGILWLINYQYK